MKLLAIEPKEPEGWMVIDHTSRKQAMVHGLLFGKTVAPDLICTLSLVKNAKNDIIL